MPNKQLKTIFILACLVFFGSAFYQEGMAQTYRAIYNFTGNRDGALPLGRVVVDSAGNLYGTTQYGGNAFYSNGNGSVYRLAHHGSSWILSPIYAFTGDGDGAHPSAGVTLGPDGAVYGTTSAGGTGNCTASGFTGCGTVFRLRPSPTPPLSVLAPWTKTTLYQFSGGSDGGTPGYDLTFFDANTIYSTTAWRGNPGCFGDGCGVVYKLGRSGGTWTESTIYRFSGDAGGCCPNGGIAVDQAGSLYGTTLGFGQSNGGTAFQLTQSGSNWNEDVLYQFDSTFGGFGPSGTLLRDSSGNLYGTNQASNVGQGNLFELTPGSSGWTQTVLHSFTGGADGGSPMSGLVADAAGNLYGTTMMGGEFGFGVVFELSLTGGHWNYRVLHSFAGGADGSYPSGAVTVAPNGKIYGATQTGGPDEFGLLFEIAP
jgi:uncharacterized repeat protein (TIGR03803 family)